MAVGMVRAPGGVAGSGAWCALLLALAAAPAARAQVPTRLAQEAPRPATDGSLELHWYAGPGAGLMVSPDQIGWLGYDGVAGRAWVTAGTPLSDVFLVEGHVASTLFGSSGDDGGLVEIGGGLRAQIGGVTQPMHLSPALHLNMGITGPSIRPTISASVGLYLDLTRSWALGPVVQYGQVFQPDGERYSTDARYFTFGVGVSMRPAGPEPPPRESPAMRMVRRQLPPEDAPEPAPMPEPPPSPELMVLIDEAVQPLQERRVSSSELLAPILFEHDSVQFIPCGEAALYEARDAINEHPGRAVLEGHADTTGEPDYNLELARRRAEAVRDWMVAHGVAPRKMEVTSSGECCQLEREDEHTDDSRRQINRRVIVRFEDPEPDTVSESDSVTDSVTDSESDSGSDSDSETDTVSDSDSVTDSESDSESESESESETESDPEALP